MFIDYYAILGLTEFATQDDVRIAFKKQALKWHPDRNLNIDTTQNMQEINEAYLILKDTEARGRYDNEYKKFKYNISIYNQEFKQDKNNVYSENSYVYNVEDEILKKWMDNARIQAVDLAKQMVDDLKGMVKVGAKAATKELGNQIGYQIIFGLLVIMILLLSKACS
ncbi:MAG: hypothetical protein JWO58_2532 [Chitinophagaceae bacterium]|nr:hypothetical protein [Chitinophagaceae bacterium]